MEIITRGGSRITFPIFKIRCSQIGNIMTEPKSKIAKEKGYLSETAKTYCDLWIKEHLFNRKYEFSSKYTQKGNIVEDNSIDFIADQLGIGFAIKNEKFFENDFLTGTPDIILSDLVIDAKNSWSWDTFPILYDFIPNTDYYWQGQGYMDLTKRMNYKIVYVLSDTPINLIEKEAYKYSIDNGYGAYDEDILSSFIKKMTYPDIPNDIKIKAFEFKYNKEDVDRIYRQVEKCRNYIEHKIKTL